MLQRRTTRSWRRPSSACVVPHSCWCCCCRCHRASPPSRRPSWRPPCCHFFRTRLSWYTHTHAHSRILQLNTHLPPLCQTQVLFMTWHCACVHVRSHFAVVKASRKQWCWQSSSVCWSQTTTRFAAPPDGVSSTFVHVSLHMLFHRFDQPFHYHYVYFRSEMPTLVINICCHKQKHINYLHIHTTHTVRNSFWGSVDESQATVYLCLYVCCCVCYCNWD